MIVIRGTIDEVVLKCLRDHYPDFSWDYGYDWRTKKKDKKKAIGTTDKFVTLVTERGSMFDVLLNWFSVEGYSVYSKT